MANDSFEALIKAVSEKPIRLLLTGPTGVGKSTLACKMAQKFNITHIEHDSLKRSNRKCTLHNFYPYDCFSGAISSKQEFVIDIGGGTVFRCDKDNAERLKRMIDFKDQHGLTIVMLTADRTVVLERYLKKGTSSDFKDSWRHWQVACAWWSKCADFILTAN